MRWLTNFYGFLLFVELILIWIYFELTYKRCCLNHLWSSHQKWWFDWWERWLVHWTSYQSFLICIRVLHMRKEPLFYLIFDRHVWCCWIMLFNFPKIGTLCKALHNSFIICKKHAFILVDLNFDFFELICIHWFIPLLLPWYNIFFSSCRVVVSLNICLRYFLSVKWSSWNCWCLDIVSR